jgi:phosphoglycerol transferase MdoB-like AlkP superfamily enzyme
MRSLFASRYLRLQVWFFLLAMTVQIFFYFLFLWINRSSATQGVSNAFFSTFGLSLHYDLFIASYLSVPVFIFWSVGWIAGRSLDRWRNWLLGYYFLVFSFLIVLLIADLPYYAFFRERITRSVHLWIGSPLEMVKIIFLQPIYYPYLIAFLLSAFLLYRLIRSLMRKQKDNAPILIPTGNRIVVFLFWGLLLFWGMRGGRIYRTIQMKEAFLAGDPFLNQLPVSPAFSYINSLTAFRLQFSDDELAMARVQARLGSHDPGHPFARQVQPSGSPKRFHVVMILLESMSEAVSARLHPGLFPDIVHRIDSIGSRSWYFSNAWSAGIHTCNGVFSSLYGFPAMMQEHPMSTVRAASQTFSGLPGTLKRLGYRTEFFCSHDAAFDNLSTFIPANGFDRIIDRHAFPPEAMSNEWGVSDEFLFERAIASMDSSAALGTPFFTLIQTISTHEPAAPPGNTKYRSGFQTPFEQAYDYTDWCVGRFFETAATRPWYDSTVFVLVGDHGRPFVEDYPAPLAFNHVLLLIRTPGMGDTLRAPIDQPVMQIDLFPTIMGILQQPYLNTTPGADVFREPRPYAYFSQDHQLAVVGKDQLYIENKYGSRFLYALDDRSKTNRLEQSLSLADSMAAYAHDALQMTDWVLEHRLAGYPGK